jgi:pimeloyl-ACP methyl ester carboxylesterase
VSQLENTKTVEVNGASLAYCEQGEGEPVVFVHGSVSDLRTWQLQLPSIGASFRAITYSRRYARPNEDIERDADDQMLPHVEDLVAFLEAVDAGPAHLVGNSWGAFVSLLTAIRHPKAVRSLVLEEPPVIPLMGLSFPPRTLEVLSLLIRRPRFALALAQGTARAMQQVESAFRRDDAETALETFGAAVLGKEPYRQLPEARKQQMRENVNTLREQILGDGFPPVRDDEVRAVTAPTLLISGEQSPAAIPLLLDCLEELLPNVERICIADASHLMHEENAPAVNEAILRFLRRDREIAS